MQKVEECLLLGWIIGILEQKGPILFYSSVKSWSFLVFLKEVFHRCPELARCEHTLTNTQHIQCLIAFWDGIEVQMSRLGFPKGTMGRKKKKNLCSMKPLDVCFLLWCHPVHTPTYPTCSSISKLALWYFGAVGLGIF